MKYFVIIVNGFNTPQFLTNFQFWGHGAFKSYSITPFLSSCRKWKIKATAEKMLQVMKDDQIETDRLNQTNHAKNFDSLYEVIEVEWDKERKAGTVSYLPHKSKTKSAFLFKHKDCKKLGGSS